MELRGAFDQLLVREPVEKGRTALTFEAGAVGGCECLDVGIGPVERKVVVARIGLDGLPGDFIER